MDRQEEALLFEHQRQQTVHHQHAFGSYQLSLKPLVLRVRKTVGPEEEEEEEEGGQDKIKVNICLFIIH